MQKEMAMKSQILSNIMTQVLALSSIWQTLVTQH
jgi:hypothetical protein